MLKRQVDGVWTKKKIMILVPVFLLSLTNFVTSLSNLAPDMTLPEPHSVPQSSEPSNESEWPMFRRSLNHTGYTPAAGPMINNVIWNHTAGWETECSPAIVDGVVYFGYDNHETGFFALDAKNGSVLWSKGFGGSVRSSPAVADGIVYFGVNTIKKFFAYNATSGAHIWNYSLPDEPDTNSPAVAGGIVYISTWGNEITALNATDGSFIWSYTTGGDIRSSPAVVNGILYIGSHDTDMYALNATDGSKIWNYDTGNWINSAPAVADGIVYFGSRDTKVYALNASAQSMTPAQRLIWSYTTGGQIRFTSPAVANDVVYIGSDDNKLYALNASDGFHIWNYSTGGDIHSSPAVANGAVYVGSDDGKVYCFYATNGTKIWDYSIGGVWWASPAISNGILYIGSRYGMRLYAIGLIEVESLGGDWPMIGYDPAGTSFSPSNAPNTNGTTWVSDLPGGTVWAYPLVAEGKVFIGTGGNFTAWNETDGSLVWSFRAPAQPGYPNIAAVADGRVFFGTAEPGPGGCIYALNTTTDEQIWNFTTEGYVRAPPVVAEDRLYIGGDLDSTGKVYCINATTGASIWNYTTQDRMTWVAVAYGKVYAGCGHWETSTKAAIYCLDMYDGSYIWSFDTGKDFGGALSVANGKVYFSASYEGSNCAVFALNATNGDVVWSTTRYSNGAAGGTAVAYGKVFITLGYGARGVYALNETNGDEIWAFRIIPEQPGPGNENNPGGGPVVADGKVFFAWGYPGHMFYAVNETTGAVVWSYKLGGSVHSRSSAIANGRVFVADHYDKKLYAFGGPPYVVTIEAYCYTEGSDISVSMTMDGSPTGYNTPHTFTGLTGTHTFTVPSADASGHPFTKWNTGSTSTTITVSSGGIYTAYYGETPYDVTINAYCYTEPTAVSVGITMDGSPTGYNTPHTFTGLTGTHTFTVPGTDASGHPFKQWSTGSTSTTITVTSDGTYTAYYGAPAGVGGIVIPINRFGLLAPYIGLTSTILVAIVAAAIYVKRVKHRKEKQ